MIFALKFHKGMICYFRIRYSKEDSLVPCKDVDDERPMIKCGFDECEIEWFHFERVRSMD